MGYSSKIYKSYGVICSLDDKLVMIKRLNSIEYFNIITGKYKNLSELESYFGNITVSEWETFKNCSSFEEAWYNLWNSERVKFTLVQKKKYDYIRQILNWKMIEKDIYLTDTELSFPKGKKVSERETDVDCALREFTEETGIKRESIILDNKIKEHKYRGSDLNYYYITYYCARIDTEKIDWKQCQEYDKYEVERVVFETPDKALESVINRNTRDLLFTLI